MICRALRRLRERLQRACFAIGCVLVAPRADFSSCVWSLGIRELAMLARRSWLQQGRPLAVSCVRQRVFLLGGREVIRGRSISSARTQCTGGTAQVIVRLWAHSIIYSVSTTTEATSLISLEIDVKISLNLGSPGQAVTGTALSILGTALEIAGFGTPLTTY